MWQHRQSTLKHPKGPFPWVITACLVESIQSEMWAIELPVASSLIEAPIVGHQ